MTTVQRIIATSCTDAGSGARDGYRNSSRKYESRSTGTARALMDRETGKKNEGSSAGAARARAERLRRKARNDAERERGGALNVRRQQRLPRRAGVQGRACALVLGQVAVLEAEVALLPLAPRAFPVEVDVHALLVLLRDRLRLRMPLEPRQVLDVETP